MQRTFTAHGEREAQRLWREGGKARALGMEEEEEKVESDLFSSTSAPAVVVVDPPSLSFSFSLASVSPEPLAQRLGAFKAKLARGKPGRFESSEIAPAVERGGAGPRKRGRKEKGKGRGRGRGRQYE